MIDDLTVRMAGADETDALMDLCRELHQENGLFEMDEDLVHGMLVRAFNKQGGVVGVIGPRNDLQAAIYMLLSNFWYSRQPHLEELWSYVRPQYRKSLRAKKLISFAKDCADTLDIPLVIGIVSNTRTEEKIRLYQRQLHKPAGAFFVYNSKWSQDAAPPELPN